MGTLTDARLDVAEIVAAALPTVPVWAYPPNNAAAPCAFVSIGAAIDQPIADRWNASLTITLVSPGGDNEMSILTLEDMILKVARAVSQGILSPVTWDTPGIMTISGANYFSVSLNVPVDIEPVIQAEISRRD